MSTFDFHLHSTVSDGQLSPGDLVRLAHAQGVTLMALTDHDSTDGLPDALAAASKLGVRVVAGIELSTDVPGASIHVLGLFLDYQQPHFQEMVRRFREARIGRAQQMVDALVTLGAPIQLDRVLQIAGEGSVGRPHVAQALLEAGHVQTLQEAFERFLANGKPAYFEGFKLVPQDAIALIHSAGGFASWAHPYELDGKSFREYLPLLLDGGVDGLEAYYSKDYGLDGLSELLTVCDEHKLIPTVGSDYHGFAGMERLPGSVQAPPDLPQRIEARADAVKARA